MKKMILGLVTLVAVSAYAEEKTVMTCSVPNNNQAATAGLTLGLTADASADFVRVVLTEGQTQSVFYNQVDRGQIASSIQGGALSILLMTESTQLSNGVITNSGFLAAGKKQDGTYGGAFFAKGNVYPLSCQVAP